MMAFPLYIGQDAQDDLLDAWAYYESQQAGLGDLFEEELDFLLGKICDGPKSYQVVYEQKRRAILRRFNFNVFFTFDGFVVHVLAVIHGGRNPERWQKR